MQNLLRKKAAEELKKEQERKAEERRRAIQQRVGKAKPLEDKNEASLQAIIRDYYKRIQQLGMPFQFFSSLPPTHLSYFTFTHISIHVHPKTESEKYDIELAVRFRDFEIKDLLDKVNNCRGKL